jgi:hypothetical protein
MIGVPIFTLIGIREYPKAVSLVCHSRKPFHHKGFGFNSSNLPQNRVMHTCALAPHTLDLAIQTSRKKALRQLARAWIEKMVGSPVFGGTKP